MNVPHLKWVFLTALMAIVPAAPALSVPFVLPWNDSSPGVTDFSSLNTPITSATRVAVDTNGHFVANGQRVRFLGLNFAGDSPFMPTNKADAVAARLAKFGVNCVRFHHMDASWASGGGILSYTSTTSTNINRGQLDRVHYLVSRLTAHGVYSDINLLVGREYRSADSLGPEVTQMDWKDAHILGYFNDTALDLQKDYATKLLTPTNRFTGLPLASDPGVAFVEVINENGILQKWYDSGLDRLPARYAAQLQARWNDWLATRYANDAAMLASWHAVDQPLGTNLLKNGAFTNGLANWNPEQHDVARAQFVRTYDFTNGRPSARITVTNAGSQSWYIQFNQPNLSIIAGKPYTISFWAKAASTTTLDASIMRAWGDWAAVGYSQTLNLTTNWQHFITAFAAPVTDSNVRVNFGGLGNKLATVYLADVILQPGGQVGLPPGGTGLATKNVPNVAYSGGGFPGTSDTRKDWIRFLRDLEYRYYDAMCTHLRSNIGYSGLIFGTIMANSPATVQSRLDLIDGHAYWQHPQFPGQPWDSVNWSEPNISMVNTLGDDNTLAGLARQRIKGKPFTVTEYQHPSPNYYGAEGPLLLAAYGALQDWDGLWLFDYGPGNDSVTMGYARGYFDTAQHPTKMANILAAANLFRRGDVAAASNEITMALTPQAEVDLLAKAGQWSVFSGSQLGVPGKLAFTNRLSINVGDNATGLTAPPPAPTGNILTSDSGELQWKLATPGRGLVTINTPQTKALIGFADNIDTVLGDIALRAGSTKLGWCSLVATLTRGNSFTNNSTALIIAGGWWENTGQIWSNTNKDSVGNHWGGPPVLAEVVPFTLTIPVNTNRVRIWALDERGQRKMALPVRGNAGSTTLDINTNAGTIWYEMEVKPAPIGFQLWREQQFSTEELANSAISGQQAVPASDGVPNLLKYYSGLPAKTLALPSQIPLAARHLEGIHEHLAISYLRDKAVMDVTCVAEISPDLSLWSSGTNQTAIAKIEDLGSSERILVYDLTPADAAAQRFMRLRLDLQ